MVDDISHEGLRILLREEGVSFQRIEIWKTSLDPGLRGQQARVEHFYAITDGEVRVWRPPPPCRRGLAAAPATAHPPPHRPERRAASGEQRAASSELRTFPVAHPADPVSGPWAAREVRCLCIRRVGYLAQPRRLRVPR